MALLGALALGSHVRAQSFSPLTLRSDASVQQLQFRDLDQDSVPEVILLDGDGKVSIIALDAAGTVVSESEVPVEQATAFDLADFDGSGALDFFFGFGSGSQAPAFLNDGSGVFTSGSQALAASQARALGVGDLDGDGDRDVVIANGASEAFANKIWLNNSRALFTSGQELGLEVSSDVAVADFDGDGDADVWFSNPGAADQFWSNDGVANFLSTEAPGGLASASAATGDFNGDGRIDIALGLAGTGGVRVLINAGDGVFANAWSALLSEGITLVEVADVNADERLDLLVGSETGNGLALFAGLGDGTFQTAGRLGTGRVSAVAAADLEADGDLDLVTANSGNQTILWLSDQVFRIRALNLRNDGSIGVIHDSDVASYFVLSRGTSPDSLDQAVAIAMGESGQGVLIDAIPAPEFAFYQVEKISVETPLDLDGDGIHDLYELENADILDPFDPADAELDFDGDGLTNLDEFLAGTQLDQPDSLLTPVLGFSPANGEEMVNVTRQTIVRFGGEVDPSTVTSDSFTLVANGEVVPGRVAVSPTGRFATYFYESALPASTEVRARIDGNIVKDTSGQSVDANGDGVPGGIGVADFRTLPLTRIPGTVVFGFVKDSFTQEPIVGATIRVDAFPEADAVTDSEGRFELVDMPAPEFFVHIDGSTASGIPEGFTYPNVGKSFKSVPGQETQIEMDGEVFDAYLPLMALDDFQPLDDQQPADIGFGNSAKDDLADLFPEVDSAVWERMQVTIDPGAALDDNGDNLATAGTILAVPPDRLPAPLPVGIDADLVISVQVPGATNFSVPAAISYPNLAGLAPGEKQLIFTFNHDAGDWEVIGTGTVSPDGLSIISDEGVGVPAPGWGFTPSQPSVMGSGGAGGSGGCGGGGGGAGGGAGPGGGGSGGSGGAGGGSGPGGDGGGSGGDGSGDAEGEGDGLDGEGTFGSGSGDKFNKNFQDRLSDAGKLMRQVVGLSIEAVELLFSGASSGQIRLLQGVSVALALKDAINDPNPENITNAVASILSFVPGPVGVLARIVSVGLAIKDLREANQNLQKAAEAKSAGCGSESSGRLNLADLILEFPTLESVFTIEEQMTENAVAQVPLAEVLQANLLRVQELTGKLNPDVVNGGLSGAEFTELNGLLDDVAAGFTQLSEMDLLTDQGLEYNEAFKDVTTELVGDGFRSVDHAVHMVAMYNGFVQRGMTSLNGDFLLTLPAGTFVSGKVYDPVTNTIGFFDGFTGRSGSRNAFSESILGSVEGLPDQDGDGLVDEAEIVIGTSVSMADTDQDGVNDFAEVKQGLDPLDGRAFPTGVIATLPLQGQANRVVAVSTADDPETVFAFVATGTHGLAIVDVSDFDSPIVLGQLDLPGEAVDVAVDPLLNLAVVASGVGGVHVVDIFDAMAPRLVDTLAIKSQKLSVDNGILYAAIGGRLQAYDLVSRRRLDSIQVTDSPDVTLTGMAVSGNTVFVMDSGRTLSSLRMTNFALQRLGSLRLGDGGGQLFAGGGIAYAAATNNSRGGYSTVDISDPGNMRELSGSDVPSGFVTPKQAVVANGSGLGLLIGQSGNTPAVDLMNLNDPSETNQFITRFTLSTAPRDAAIGAGLAFIASGEQGLQVVNYLPFDSFGEAPTVSMELNGVWVSEELTVEEGQQLQVSARVTDDVQGRDVEFYVNGERIASDVSFPFEQAFNAPTIDKDLDTFTVQAKVTDTGGNIGWSEEITVSLTADASQPVILSEFPLRGSVGAPSQGVGVFLSEPIQDELLSDHALSVVFAGADNLVGTGDDQTVSAGFPVYRRELFSVAASLRQELEPGLYRVTLSLPVIDFAGNRLDRPYVWQFWVRGSVDLDGDGFPDVAELAYGLDPSNPDTDGNGVLDGDEDPDGDGLRSGDEVLANLDPTLADTDENGVPDGEEDIDGDSLNNLREVDLGTSFFLADSDADLWNDENEVTVGSDPLDPGSIPNQVLTASPITEISIPSATNEDGVVGVVYGGPITTVSIPSATSERGGAGTVYGGPIVEMNIPTPEGVGEGANGIVIGRPVVSLTIPAPSELPGGSSRAAYGRPIVELNLPAVTSTLSSLTKTAVGRPEVIVIIGDDDHQQ